MTPHLASEAGIIPVDGHLTEEQFGELIAESPGTNTERVTAAAHLRDCEQCAAELASLQECLSLFREASTAYANRELRGVPRVVLPARRRLLFFPGFKPAYLAAAAALVLAALLPMQLLHRRAPHPAPAVATKAAPAAAESDEALLEDVNDDVSASVPASMQELADPTGTSTGIETSNQNPEQRN